MAIDVREDKAKREELSSQLKFSLGQKQRNLVLELFFLFPLSYDVCALFYVIYACEHKVWCERGD